MLTSNTVGDGGLTTVISYNDRLGKKEKVLQLTLIPRGCAALALGLLHGAAALGPLALALVGIELTAVELGLPTGLRLR